ncbi:MAG: zinc-binding dehydrogenase, partial [Clostridia bacterium]|nr:zinc-binding dehydrogenase [Clostridia bacterium]
EAGYDDVFVFAPVPALIEQGDALLGYDGCLNFFAGPTDRAFSSAFNFYNVHYAAHHLAGTSGGNIDDMREALDMIAAGRLNPAGMVTHIGGLDAAAQATLALPKLPGGKKLIYTGISLSLTAIDDLGSSEDPLLRGLGAICARSNGLWCAEAERYLLDHAKRI